jgi:uncharacterized protein
MLEIIKQPWHWSISGIMIGLLVPILLLLGNKKFGISSSYRHTCASIFPYNISFFKYNWKNDIWNIIFVFGIIIGGFLGNTLLKSEEPIKISPKTKDWYLNNIGLIKANEITNSVVNWETLFSPIGLLYVVIGGFLVGFGTRYAGGCTSGHSITGISNFQKASFVATIFFMIGGFFATHIIIPYFFKFFIR